MITTINEFKILLEAKKSDKQYKKEVALYKFFVVNTKTKKVVSGWEFKDDAKDALSDFDGDKDYKVLSELQLKKLGIDNPKQKWINESIDNIVLTVFTLTNNEEKYSMNEIIHIINNFNKYKMADNIVKWLYEIGYSYNEILTFLNKIKNGINVNTTLYLSKLKVPFKQQKVLLESFIKESNDSVRAMSFTIPEKKDWIEMGENLGIKYMGKTYWIKPNDKTFFEENIAKNIKFKYIPSSMYIEFPTLLR